MECPQCGETVEAGAAFCGNCGQPLTALTTSVEPPTTSIQQVVAQQPNESALPADSLQAAGVPAYAVPQPKEQSSQMKATMSLVIGTLGLVGALFLPVAGLILGLVGFILATLSRRLVRHGVSTAGIIVSILAIVVGLGTWTYVVARKSQPGQQASTGTATTQATANLQTPCYTVIFPKQFNVVHASGSCDMSAYNGDTLNNSSDAYKVYGVNTAVSAVGFQTMAKQAIEKDVRQSLPSFSITNESSGNFAGSPAYFVTTNNGQGVTLVEAVVLHQSSQSQNFFVFIHAVNGSSVSLNDLQSGWQWQ